MVLNNNIGFSNVLPPRLEDAGLEDPALPSHTIQEAFKRAADALHTVQGHVRSTTVHSFGCIRIEEEESAKSSGRAKAFDGSSTNRNGSAVLGEESCLDTKTGGLVEEGHDLVVGQNAGLYESDKVEFGKREGQSWATKVVLKD